MSLFLALLPLYLLGNLHCVGMCGPLVLMIGQNRFRYWYFFGRAISFSLAGMIAGGMGALISGGLQQLHISSVFSFTFGIFFTVIGVYSVLGWEYPGKQWLSKRLVSTSRTLSLLMLKEQAWPIFLFGFFTLLLPCGQTVIVFSACALEGDAAIGFGNGLAFALITSPSLWLAMKAHGLLMKFKGYYPLALGFCSFLVGLLAICRGLADQGTINHLAVNLFTAHIVVF